MLLLKYAHWQNRWRRSIERFMLSKSYQINQGIDQNYQEKQKQYITINWQREINELTASTATSLFDINNGMAAV